MTPTRILVTGWFSFANGTATAGDLLARDLVCEWLAADGWAYDVATAPPFRGGVDVQGVDPSRYSHVMAVCGPFERGELERILLARFWRCRLIGLDLTLPTPLEEWNPFDYLIERDSSRAANPDFVFASRQPLPPVVGVCLVEAYPAGATEVTDAAVRRLVASRPMAVIDVDTRLDANATGFRTAGEIESVIARLDVMITTRLHGAVLALKHGVPAIAIDPEPGGTKLRTQAAAIDWPVIFHAGDLRDAALAAAFAYCLTREARQRARSCGERAAAAAAGLGEALRATLRDPEALERARVTRLALTPQFVGWRLPGDADAPAEPASPTPPRPRGRMVTILDRLTSGRWSGGRDAP
jgi:hypothetical protein